MRSLQTELRRLKITKLASSRRARKKRPRQSQNVKHWQSAYDWSEVETELLESQPRDRG